MFLIGYLIKWKTIEIAKIENKTIRNGKFRANEFIESLKHIGSINISGTNGKKSSKTIKVKQQSNITTVKPTICQEANQNKRTKKLVNNGIKKE